VGIGGEKIDKDIWSESLYAKLKASQDEQPIKLAVCITMY
jgi:hypothetical protein